MTGHRRWFVPHVEKKSVNTYKADHLILLPGTKRILPVLFSHSLFDSKGYDREPG